MAMRRKKDMAAAEEELFAKTNEEDFPPEDEFEWGMIEGKLSALHWAQGNEWDFMDDPLSGKKRTVMRKPWEIAQAEEEYFDRIWFGRNSMFILDENGKEILVPKHGVACPAFERILAKYGEESLTVQSDYQWGEWSGRLSALRWILGDEWDDLDS